ncbi:alkaline phosphatase [Aliidiomarina maris]|uniref:Alkaline phosphatase n=1 Tax=Aliidiomarina maris TaxID=531312 RepID=A0A327XAJ9_9GAMM|nr:alkaline phosphatase [Aliidiomarina maris]RAK00697.1 alkaline phosphatase [Aliidiomarina maris]RUO27301.1 alkaline phosphatase [Aliidiomarina maris]
MLHKLVAKTLITGTSLLAVAGFTFATTSTAYAETERETPRNLIMVIGDGMGSPYLHAYRYFKDSRGMTDRADIEHTIFDRYLVGSASTYPADDTLVTDSAASATTLASGIKTYNGAIGLDPNREPVKSMMEYANERGMLTAALATVQVTHATPAAFFTQAESRRMENQIADQFATRNEDGEWKFDLLVGGGRDFFVRPADGDEPAVDHLEYFRNNGMRVVESLEALQTQQRLPLIGLLADRNLPYVIDSEPRLKQMTEESLRLLENEDKPFVIMIEASMIDWCGHGNDIGCAMHEMRELEELLEFLVPYVEERGDTALVVTADHSTGGLTLGADGHYQFRVQEIQRQGRALRTMATELMDMPWIDWEAYIEKHLPYPLSTEQQQAIADVAEYEGDNHRVAINDVLRDILNYHTRAGWTTGGHTGEDVPVIAAGPWADYFRGVQDHSDIANQFIEWIKAND